VGVQIRRHGFDVRLPLASLSLLVSELILLRPLSARVFILGPSHHVYLDGCALSACSTYETPIGSLDLDLDRSSFHLYASCRSTDLSPTILQSLPSFETLVILPP